jgi:hypothetical protein
VVDTGDTATGVLLVAANAPGSTLPVPLLNTPVKVVEVPAVIVAAAETKLVMVGAATTVTVTCLVTVAPAVFDTVRV